MRVDVKRYELHTREGWRVDNRHVVGSVDAERGHIRSGAKKENNCLRKKSAKLAKLIEQKTGLK